MPAHQQSEDATIQNRSCSRCAEAQRTQVRPTTEHPIGQQDPKPSDVRRLYDGNKIPLLITSLFKNSNAPYLNRHQNINNRGKTATIVPDRARALRTAVRANNLSHVLIAEVLT